MKKLFSCLSFCLMTMLLFIVSAHASGMDSAVSFLDSAKKYLADNAVMLSSVGAIIFGIIKAVSNEKASAASNKILKAVAFLQAQWDYIPKMVLAIGELLLMIIGLLAKILKSDGIGGAK